MTSKKKDKKYVIIVEEGCTGCAELKKSMPHLDYLDVAKSRDGSKLADALGVEYVPAVISVDGQGKICVLDDNMKVIKCVRKRASQFPSLTRVLRR